MTSPELNRTLCPTQQCISDPAVLRFQSYKVSMATTFPRATFHTVLIPEPRLTWCSALLLLSFFNTFCNSPTVVTIVLFTRQIKGLLSGSVP